MLSTPSSLWSQASFTFIIISANNTQCPELGWETSYSPDTLAIYPRVLFSCSLYKLRHTFSLSSPVDADRCIHHGLPPPASPLPQSWSLLADRHYGTPCICWPSWVLNRSVERLMRQFSGLTRCVKVTPPDPAPCPPASDPVCLSSSILPGAGPGFLYQDSPSGRHLVITPPESQDHTKDWYSSVWMLIDIRNPEPW